MKHLHPQHQPADSALIDDELKDLEFVRKAGFTPNVNMFAQAAIASLHWLKSLSLKLGLPLEQLTAQHIIQELSQEDVRIREHEQRFSAFPATKRK